MIVRCLSLEEIKKVYPDRKIFKPHRQNIREGYDYVVISLEILMQKKQKEQSIRYWIVDDHEWFTPFDAYNFKIIDPHPASAWIISIRDKKIDISHPQWMKYGYVEDYFDNPQVEKGYNKIIKSIFDEAVKRAFKEGIKLNLGTNLKKMKS